VSKQAAQQKLGTQFERFTQRARAVVVGAQEAARSRKHDYIGTEHLLIGLLGEPQGLAAEALAELAGSIEAVQTAVEAKMPAGGQKAPKGHIAFTPRSREALEQSLQAALRLGHNHIGTEHILLGLLADPNSLAAQALADLEITPEKAERQVKIGLAGFLAKKATEATEPDEKE
jgi:ATP-dependent Clp protease ATP-binding subunit ClpA